MTTGLADPLLSKLSKCGKNKFDSHTCRNLHSTIKAFKKALPVKTSTVPTLLRRSRRRLKKIPVDYPVLHFSDWAEVIFNAGGHFFLGGKDLDSAHDFGLTLKEFWIRFRGIEPEFHFYKEVGEEEFAYTIPIALHGDEGRGKQKQPVMVMGVQAIIPIKDFKSNMEGPLILFGPCFGFSKL